VFIGNGTVIRSVGWRSVLNDKDEERKDEDNLSLPKVKKREELMILQKAFLDKQTKPKPLYNEASLLKALETLGRRLKTRNCVTR